MKYVVNAAEMKEYDERTRTEHHMDSLILMERAAMALTEEVYKRRPAPASVLIVAGTGNNGGDGFAVGRMLRERGYQVSCLLVGERENCSPECLKQIEILESYGMMIGQTSNLEDAEYDIIVDALFGVGLSRQLTGEYFEVVEHINQMKGYKVACDLPSGIDCDTGQIMGNAVKADLTVTFGFMKQGLLLSPGVSHAGEVVCASAGITEESFGGHTPKGMTYDLEDLKRMPDRNPDGNKGNFGKILVIAGSKNMAGAACLAAKSAYRIGGGLVRIFTPEENRSILQMIVPEAVLHSYKGEKHWIRKILEKVWKNQKVLRESERKQLREDVDWANSIIVGPGLGKDERAVDVLRELLKHLQFAKKQSCLMDADALNLLSEHAELNTLYQKVRKDNPNVTFIMTPHRKEFSRLMGFSVNKLNEDVTTYVTKYAKKNQTIVVCKDACTVVAGTDGSLYFNQSGNDSLATAGSGDVLTGVIGGLIGQGMSEIEAARLGAYLHGLTGELASKETNSYCVTAGDLPEALCQILQDVENGACARGGVRDEEL